MNINEDQYHLSFPFKALPAVIGSDYTGRVARRMFQLPEATHIAHVH